MNRQNLLFFGMGLLLLFGVIWYALSVQNQKALQRYSATIQRDCAPWDGSAFTTLVPINDGMTLQISIWQAPDIKLPVTFSFPDETGQVGNASYLLPTGSAQELSGTVWFSHVEQDVSVEGEFHLVSKDNKQFNGKFTAQWRSEIVFCG